MAHSGVQAGTCFMKNKQTQPRAGVLVEFEDCPWGIRFQLSYAPGRAEPWLCGRARYSEDEDEVMLGTRSKRHFSRDAQRSQSPSAVEKGRSVTIHF